MMSVYRIYLFSYACAEFCFDFHLALIAAPPTTTTTSLHHNHHHHHPSPHSRPSTPTPGLCTSFFFRRVLASGRNMKEIRGAFPTQLFIRPPPSPRSPPPPPPPLEPFPPLAARGSSGGRGFKSAVTLCSP